MAAYLTFSFLPSQLLLSEGAHLNATTNTGETVLHFAARYDQSAMVFFYLAADPLEDPNYDAYGLRGVAESQRKSTEALVKAHPGAHPRIRHATWFGKCCWKPDDPMDDVADVVCPCSSGKLYLDCHAEGSSGAFTWGSRSVNTAELKMQALTFVPLPSKYGHRCACAQAIGHPTRVLFDRGRLPID